MELQKNGVSGEMEVYFDFEITNTKLLSFAVVPESVRGEQTSCIFFLINVFLFKP
ncbi:MAG: hypothetical protein J5I59_10165 [Saprospiraceae bacterium]|nr:hypothetical protein [Saprospiraceae bacterium]